MNVEFGKSRWTSFSVENPNLPDLELVVTYRNNDDRDTAAKRIHEYLRGSYAYVKSYVVLNITEDDKIRLVFDRDNLEDMPSILGGVISIPSIIGTIF